MKALEKQSAEEGILLTEEQLKCLEKARHEKEAHGEIETEHPGYLGSQDTYFVGTMKGVGRIYQQTFVDTYSRVAFAKLYTEKTAITAAHMLNEAVLPWFNEQEVRMLRILTDRGTEYCGRIEEHAYQLFLGIEDIDHSRTKARSPQTNGICERFHKTMKHEFYDIAFRKKVYRSIEELQSDVNEWLKNYNELRPHSGSRCYGKTPMRTFMDAKSLAIEKQLDKFITVDHNNMKLMNEVNALSKALSIVESIAPSAEHFITDQYQGAHSSEFAKGFDLTDRQSV